MEDKTYTLRYFSFIVFCSDKEYNGGVDAKSLVDF